MKKLPNPRDNPGTSKFSRLRLNSNEKPAAQNSFRKVEKLSSYFNVNIPTDSSNINKENNLNSPSPYKQLSEIKSSENDSNSDENVFATPKPSRKHLPFSQRNIHQKKSVASNTSKRKKKKSTGQTKITTLLKKNASELEVNADDLQVALACSKSLVDTNNENDELDGKSHKINNVKATWEQFGFNRRQFFEEKSKKKKQSKFKYITPTLFTRTVDDREALISTKISNILSNFISYNQSVFDYNLKSTRLKQFHCYEDNIFAKNNVALESIDEGFYHTMLKIPFDNTKSGSMLKDWSTIPGRSCSPIASVKQSNDCDKIDSPKTETKDNTIKQSVSVTLRSVSPDLFESDEDVFMSSTTNKSEEINCSNNQLEVGNNCNTYDLTQSSDDDILPQASKKKLLIYNSNNLTQLSDNEGISPEDNKVKSTNSTILEFDGPENSLQYEPKNNDKSNLSPHDSNEFCDLTQSSDSSDNAANCINAVRLESDCPVRLSIETTENTVQYEPKTNGKYASFISNNLSQHFLNQDFESDEDVLMTSTIRASTSPYKSEKINCTNNKVEVCENDYNTYDLTQSSDDDDILKENSSRFQSDCPVSMSVKTENTLQYEPKTNEKSASFESSNLSQTSLDQDSLEKIKNVCTQGEYLSFDENNTAILNVTNYVNELLTGSNSPNNSREKNKEIYYLEADLTREEVNCSSSSKSSDCNESLLLTDANKKENRSNNNHVKVLNDCNSNQSTPKNVLIKTSNITPMLNYKEMNTPAVSKELEKFGLKPLKRHKGVKILEHIYETTHPVVQNEGEIGNKRRKLTSNGDADKICNEYTEVYYNREILKENIILDSESLIFERKRSSKIHSCQIPLQIVWQNFLLENPEIYENILLYEPLQLEVLHNMLKEQGFKFHIEDLTMFFDRKCITIRTAAGTQHAKKRFK